MKSIKGWAGFALALAISGGTGGFWAFGDDDAPTTSAPNDATEPEALLRGPVHEGYAEPTGFNPMPGVIASKKPPADVQERPPDVKPDGDDVEWIPGYWAWDDKRADFVWVSGIWRDIPPGRQWVPGYWSEVSNGYQWVSGYWAAADAGETQYLPEPPKSVENGPNVPAPGDDYFWAPGQWSWVDGQYLWTPGTWVKRSQNWVWTPGTYVSTPAGYVYNSGYWDYPLEDRGWLFAPVSFSNPLYADPGYYYTPTVSLTAAGLTDNLFCNVNSGGYYFGDYYDPAYTGFVPWYAYSSLGYGFCPLYNYSLYNGFALGRYNGFSSFCGFGGLLGYGGFGGLGGFGCGSLGWLWGTGIYGNFCGFNVWQRNCGFNFVNNNFYGRYGAGGYWGGYYRNRYQQLRQNPGLRPPGTYAALAANRPRPNAGIPSAPGLNGRPNIANRIGTGRPGGGPPLARQINPASLRNRAGIKPVAPAQQALASQRMQSLRSLAQNRAQMERSAGRATAAAPIRRELPRSPLVAQRPANLPRQNQAGARPQATGLQAPRQATSLRQPAGNPNLAGRPTGNNPYAPQAGGNRPSISRPNVQPRANPPGRNPAQGGIAGRPNAGIPSQDRMIRPGNNPALANPGGGLQRPGGNPTVRLQSPDLGNRPSLGARPGLGQSNVARPPALANPGAGMGAAPRTRIMNPGAPNFNPGASNFQMPSARPSYTQPSLPRMPSGGFNGNFGGGQMARPNFPSQIGGGGMPSMPRNIGGGGFSAPRMGGGSFGGGAAPRMNFGGGGGGRVGGGGLGGGGRHR